MLLPMQHHDEFQDTHRAAPPDAANDDDRWRHARGWALVLSIAFVARSADNAQLARGRSPHPRRRAHLGEGLQVRGRAGSIRLARQRSTAAIRRRGRSARSRVPR